MFISIFQLAITAGFKFISIITDIVNGKCSLYI